jgi:hypothetical protein
MAVQLHSSSLYVLRMSILWLHVQNGSSEVDDVLTTCSKCGLMSLHE